MSIVVKACDRCGDEVLLTEIHITWIPENHAFSWLCKKCWEKQCVKFKYREDNGTWKCD